MTLPVVISMATCRVPDNESILGFSEQPEDVGSGKYKPGVPTLEGESRYFCFVVYVPAIPNM